MSDFTSRAPVLNVITVYVEIDQICISEGVYFIEFKLDYLIEFKLINMHKIVI